VPKDCGTEVTTLRATIWSKEQLRSCLWERIAKANARARIAQACGRTAANVSRTHRCRPRVSYSHNHRVRPTEGFRAESDVRPLRLLVAFWKKELRTHQ